MWNVQKLNVYSYENKVYDHHRQFSHALFLPISWFVQYLLELFV